MGFLLTGFIIFPPDPPAFTVRALTRRFIGEYDKTLGKLTFLLNRHSSHYVAGKFTVILLHLDKLLLSLNCSLDKWLITKTILVWPSCHFSTKCAIDLTVKS